MSRTVLLMVIFLTFVFVGVVISLEKGGSESAESIASNIYNKNAEYLGSYALQWGIKQVTDEVVTDDLIQEFDDFNVLDGKINRLEWDFNWNDQSGLIKLVANVEWNEGRKTFAHQSSAIIESAKLSDRIPNAIETGGGLEVKGSAVIEGDIETYSEINFEDIFGITKEEMKAKAINIYKNPGNNPYPVNGITWIEGDVHFTSSATGMSGLLIINGYCNWSGADFDGILYVIGQLETDIEGNSVINGAILLEGSGFIRGNTMVKYDASIINSVNNEFISPPVEDSAPQKNSNIIMWTK